METYYFLNNINTFVLLVYNDIYKIVIKISLSKPNNFQKLTNVLLNNQ